MLYDVDVNGETRKVVGTFSRNGFFYTIDRANGAVHLRHALARPELDQRARSQDRQAGRIRARAADPVLCPKEALVKVGDPSTAQDDLPGAADLDLVAADLQSRDARSPGSRRSTPASTRAIKEHIDPTRADLQGNPGMWGGGNFWTFDYAFPGRARPDHRASTPKPARRSARSRPRPRPIRACSRPRAACCSAAIRMGVSSPMTPTRWRKSGRSTPARRSAPRRSRYSIDGHQYIAVVVGGSKGMGPKLSMYEAAAQVVVFGL